MMNGEKQIYLQGKGKVSLFEGENLLLRNIIEVIASIDVKNEIDNMVYPMKEKKPNIVIPMIQIVNVIKEKYPDSIITVVGEPDILVTFKNREDHKDRFKILRVAIVSFLLFIGSITAIVNFHSDVDMKQAHKTIYKMVTGEEEDRPLLLQIPYSLGIGIGMAVFFNHVFRKRINKEPSPLEVEVYMYQQNIDEYTRNNNS